MTTRIGSDIYFKGDVESFFSKLLSEDDSLHVKDLKKIFFGKLGEGLDESFLCVFLFNMRDNNIIYETFSTIFYCKQDIFLKSILVKHFIQ